MMRKRTFLQSAACIALALFGTGAMAPAQADSVYPSHPVRWVVPYAAGGATDVLSRLICQRLSERLGQPFIVENKPGAGSTIGTQAVIASPPDGYTLLLTSTANAINASFDPSLPFDFAKSIMPVAGVARIPLVLVVNNDLPVHNVSEFIAYAKANPGKMSVASSGIGTSLHLSAELFKAMAGVQFIHVPYRGSAPGLTSSFYGVGVSHDTPPEIVDLLNREINAALADPTIRQRLGELGAIPITGTPKEFGAMLATETERWRRVVEMSGQKKE
jgi:tripartite-type tricarboxylate transporter receptor subunit TctC